MKGFLEEIIDLRRIDFKRPAADIVDLQTFERAYRLLDGLEESNKLEQQAVMNLAIVFI